MNQNTNISIAQNFELQLIYSVFCLLYSVFCLLYSKNKNHLKFYAMKLLTFLFTMILFGTSIFAQSDPPALTADPSANMDGADVVITFTDDAAWRAAITIVRANTNIVLGTGYDISA